MKIDRLHSILNTLVKREKVTAPELAKKLRVSRRTIGRDIDDLCAAGFPIVTMQGSGGGIMLDEGYVVREQLLSKKNLQQHLIDCGIIAEEIKRPFQKLSSITTADAKLLENDCKAEPEIDEKRNAVLIKSQELLRSSGASKAKDIEKEIERVKAQERLAMQEKLLIEANRRSRERVTASEVTKERIMNSGEYFESAARVKTADLVKAMEKAMVENASKAVEIAKPIAKDKGTGDERTIGRHARGGNDSTERQEAQQELEARGKTAKTAFDIAKTRQKLIQKEKDEKEKRKDLPLKNGVFDDKREIYRDYFNRRKRERDENLEYSQAEDKYDWALSEELAEAASGREKAAADAREPVRDRSLSNNKNMRNSTSGRERHMNHYANAERDSNRAARNGASLSRERSASRAPRKDRRESDYIWRSHDRKVREAAENFEMDSAFEKSQAYGEPFETYQFGQDAQTGYASGSREELNDELYYEAGDDFDGEYEPIGSQELALEEEAALPQAAPSRMTVLFDGYIRPLIDQLYGDESYTITKLGKLRFEAGYADRAQALGWVLSFGYSAQIIAPQDLAIEMRDILSKAIKNYDFLERNAARKGVKATEIEE